MKRGRQGGGKSLQLTEEDVKELRVFSHWPFSTPFLPSLVELGSFPQLGCLHWVSMPTAGVTPKSDWSRRRKRERCGWCNASLNVIVA